MAYDPRDTNGDFPPPRIYVDVDFVNLCFWGTTPGGCAIWSRQKFSKTRAGYRAADRKLRINPHEWRPA